MKEDGLVNSLLLVAKELQKANFIKKFKKEFDEEMSQNLVEMNTEKSDTNNALNEATKPTENIETLRMEVFEDKEYDIEEVRFWNFISRNKGVKPSVVRTVVYKCPETSYVFKKTSVNKPKKEKQKPQIVNKSIEQDELKEQIEPKTDEIQIIESPLLNAAAKKESKKAEPSNVKITKIKSVKSLTKSTESLKMAQASQSKPEVTSFNASTSYKMEDLILIDEDDDIIGYNEDEDDINEQTKYQDNEEDTNEDDIDKHNNEDDEQDERFNYDTHESDSKSTADEIFKPKVVIEKVEEPVRKKKINVKQKKNKLFKNDTKSEASTKTNKTDKTSKQTDSNENKSKLSSNSSNTNDLINRQEHNVRVTRSNSRLVSLNL